MARIILSRIGERIFGDGVLQLGCTAEEDRGAKAEFLFDRRLDRLRQLRLILIAFAAKTTLPLLMCVFTASKPSSSKTVLSVDILMVVLAADVDAAEECDEYCHDRSAHDTEGSVPLRRVSPIPCR